MSTNAEHTDRQKYSPEELNGHTNGATNGATTNGSSVQDFHKITKHMTNEEKSAALNASRFGYGPLANIKTSDAAGMLPAFGGEFQPGLYRGVEDRKIGNPAPLGLCAFALTTFVLSLINLGTRGITEPQVVIGLAYGYGGLVQLLAGMWELAAGNTFGATALSSYGGFWISFGIILTPGGFEIVQTLEQMDQWTTSFSFYLFGWFIFTTILLICTLRSTVAFFLLFFTLDLAFLMLALSYYYAEANVPHTMLLRAGGGFGILAAFAAWYNAFAGIADNSNSFVITPVAHFPWSQAGRERRQKKAAEHEV